MEMDIDRPSWVGVDRDLLVVVVSVPVDAVEGTGHVDEACVVGVACGFDGDGQVIDHDLQVDDVPSMPGTAVDPMWSMRWARSPATEAMRAISRPAWTGQDGPGANKAAIRRRGARLRLAKFCANGASRRCHSPSKSFSPSAGPDTHTSTPRSSGSWSAGWRVTPTTR